MSLNGTEVVYEVQRAKALGLVRVGGHDHEIRPVKMKDLVRVQKLQAEARAAKAADDNVAASSASIEAVAVYVQAALPSLSREALEDLAFDEVTEIAAMVDKVLDVRRKEREAANRDVPFSAAS